MTSFAKAQVGSSRTSGCAAELGPVLLYRPVVREELRLIYEADKVLAEMKKHRAAGDRKSVALGVVGGA